jgi:hypothetical protein
MAGKYANYHNVEDFVERRLRAMIKTYAKSKRPDIAKVLEEALNNYLQGNYDIVFVDGWPHVVQESNKSDKS